MAAVSWKRASQAAELICVTSSRAASSISMLSAPRPSSDSTSARDSDTAYTMSGRSPRFLNTGKA